jgi:hypothetical protein
VSDWTYEDGELGFDAVKQQRDDALTQLREAEKAIKQCIDRSNGRYSEWGERAEMCFSYLNDYLDSKKDRP